MRKYFALLIASSLLFACGGEDSQQQDTVFVDETDQTDETSEEQVLPEIWGAPALEDENPDPDVVEVTLRAQETSVSLSEELDADMYTYNGHLPGPIIQAKVGDRVIVHFENELPEATTVHWHGLRISDEMDGSPRIQDPVEAGESFEYDFVVPEAGSYWYHPHVRTNEQIEKGLYGLLVVHGEDDPEYDAERYLTIDDILIDQNGELPGFLERRPEFMHGRTGNALLTSGSLNVAEFEAEQGDVERWRLVNPANARTMSLSIEGASWRVIGTDGGLLEQPYETDRLTLPVGQRFDVEVTYEDEGTATLFTHVLVRDENNEVVEDAFELAEASISSSDKNPRQIEWPDVQTIDQRQVDDEQVIEFDVRQTVSGATEWTLNGEANAQDPLFTFTEGDTVRIRLKNNAGPEHPFHLHGQFFTVVDDGRDWTDQPGLKDTVLVPGQEEVEIIAYLDNPGRWMAHCHILEHAELGMMSEIVVEPGQ